MQSIIDKVDMLSGAILNPDMPPLDRDETRAAAHTLVKPIYKSVCRVKIDPQIQDQKYGLFSFTPSKGARPDAHGIYGTAKLRGNYASEISAEMGAEQIVREVDSINPIYTIRVGQEFPLTVEPRFTENFANVDLSKHVSAAEKQREHDDRERERKDKKIIIDKERKLLDEHKQILDGTYEEDPLDVYIRAHVKRSQLKWTLENTKERIVKEIEPALQRAIEEISELDIKDPTLRTQYKARYMEARREAGLSTEFTCETGTQLDFMKFLDDEIPQQKLEVITEADE